MADTAAELIRDVLTPVPDSLRTRYGPLFSSTNVSTLDDILAKEFPEATKRRRDLPSSLADFAALESGTDSDAVRKAVDGFVTQYAAGVKAVHNADLRYDAYLPSCFYDHLKRVGGEEGDEADDDNALSNNWGEALKAAGFPDLSYTDRQLFFPVALGKRWGLVHVSYVEDRITLFDPAATHAKGHADAAGVEHAEGHADAAGVEHAEGHAVLGVVRDHIASADRIHFSKTHTLGTNVMALGVTVPATLSALVVCAALEVFPSRHFRDVDCPAFDKVIEAITANTPVYDLLAESSSPVVIPFGRSLSAANATIEQGGRGLRVELLDRIRCTWATGVPVNAEGVSCLVKDRA